MFQSYAFQSGGFQYNVTTDIPLPKGGIHPWYFDEYHRLRIKQNLRQIKEAEKQITTNKDLIKEAKIEIANAETDEKKKSLQLLQKRYKSEIRLLAETIAQMRAEIRESETILIIAIAMRKRMRFGGVFL